MKTRQSRQNRQNGQGARPRRDLDVSPAGAGPADAVRVIDAVRRSPQVTVLRVDQASEDQAWEWLRRHDERGHSFVDATSFAVMRRRRLRQALAFDGDFAAAGFTETRPA